MPVYSATQFKIHTNKDYMSYTYVYIGWYQQAVKCCYSISKVLKKSGTLYLHYDHSNHSILMTLNTQNHV